MQNHRQKMSQITRIIRISGVLICLVLIVFPILLCGCWGSVEIDKRAYALGIAIDEGESEIVKVTLFLPIAEKIAEEGGGEEPPFYSISDEGVTIYEALNKIQNRLDKRLFYGHLSIMFVSESVAQEGIQLILSARREEYQVGRDVQLVIVKGKAKEIYEIQPSSATNIAEYLREFFSEAARDEIKYSIDIGLYRVQERTVGLDPVVAYVGKGEDAVEFLGGAVIKNEKLIGILNRQEMRGYLLATGKSGTGIITLNELDSKDKATVRLRHNKGNVSIKIENEEPRITITSQGIFAVREYTGSRKMEETIPIIEKALVEKIEQDIRTAVESAQELNTDIFGIGKQLYYTHHDYWEQINWEEMFPRVPIAVEVSVLVRKITMAK